MRNVPYVAVLAALAVFPALGSAQSVEGFSNFGVQAGLFMPSSREVRDAFGSNWLSFGLGATGAQKYEKTKTKIDWNVISGEKDGNRVFLLTPSYGLVMPLGDRGASAQPYVAARVGISYMDYALDVDHERVSGKRIGFNGNAELGVNLSDRLNISVRYDVFSKQQGLNFNGLSLSLTYGFLRF